MTGHLKQESAIRALREFTAWLPRWCGVCGARIWFTKTWEGWVHTIGWVELVFLCAKCVKRLHQPCGVCREWGVNACIADGLKSR